MTSPAISVVMGVHNGGGYVQAAIDSILTQSFTDLELIVVDDGSTDDTAATVAACAARDRRVVFERLPQNAGLPAALNAGCRRARGALVARMDHDDASLPDRLASQEAFLRAHPEILAVGSSVLVVDHAGVVQRVHTYPSHPALVHWTMLFCNPIAHPAAMIRRSALESIGYYDTRWRHGTEDYDLFARLSGAGRIANLPAPLLRYRVWPGSLSTRLAALQERDACEILREHLERRWRLGVTPDEAAALRGLPREDWPTTTPALEGLGDLVRRLLEAFMAEPGWSAGDRAVVRRDAGTKLLLLAALASRSSIGAAISLSGQAIRMSPASLASFTRKAVARASGRR